MPRYDDQRGMSLVELLAVLGLLGVAATVTLVGSHVWIGQQASQSAVFHVQAYLQATRTESVTRNRACRFHLDPTAKLIRVMDLNDPADSGDDIEVARLRLAETIRFERPDGGSPIGFPSLGGVEVGATFEADGRVSSGAGSELVVWGGVTYHRITLFGAGGVRVENWSGAHWQAGI